MRASVLGGLLITRYDLRLVQEQACAGARLHCVPKRLTMSHNGAMMTIVATQTENLRASALDGQLLLHI